MAEAWAVMSLKHQVVLPQQLQTFSDNYNAVEDILGQRNESDVPVRDTALLIHN